MAMLYPSDPRPLRGCPVAVLDFETTGPNPSTAEPVSVAVVHIDALGDTEPAMALQFLIKPSISIPEEASKVHGIYDHHVEAAPTMAELLPDLLGALDGRLLAAFNLSYDNRILSRYAPVVPFGGLCPYVWVRAIDKCIAGKKLSDIASRRGLTFDAHDAAEDAMVTARLLPVLLGELGRGKTRQDRYGRTHQDGPWCRPEDLSSVASFWGWQVRTACAQEADYAAYCRKEGKEAPTMPWTEFEAGGAA